MTTTAVGAVTITIDDKKNKSYSADEVTPDENNQVVMTLVSSGSKSWTYKDKPITIKNDANFTWSPHDGGGTVLTVTDSGDDKKKHPKHDYTVHVQSNDGDELDIDPKIVDR